MLNGSPGLPEPAKEPSVCTSRFVIPTLSSSGDQENPSHFNTWPMDAPCCAILKGSLSPSPVNVLSVYTLRLNGSFTKPEPDKDPSVLILMLVIPTWSSSGVQVFPSHFSTC